MTDEERDTKSLAVMLNLFCPRGNGKPWQGLSSRGTFQNCTLETAFWLQCTECAEGELEECVRVEIRMGMLEVCCKFPGEN